MRHVPRAVAIGLTSLTAAAAIGLLYGCAIDVTVVPTNDAEKQAIAAYDASLQDGFGFSVDVDPSSLSLVPLDAAEDESASEQTDATGTDETASAQEAAGTNQSTPLPDTWTPDVDCTQCHSTQLATLDDESCGASSHAAMLGCTSCHTDIDNLEHAHRDYLTSTKQPTKIKYAFVETDFCLSCHESWEALAEKTADSTACTDAMGTVVNPHALPDVAEHQSIRCTNCHTMHEPQDSEALRSSAYHACVQCHHTDEFVSCTTCHNDSL